MIICSDLWPFGGQIFFFCGVTFESSAELWRLLVWHSSACFTGPADFGATWQQTSDLQGCWPLCQFVQDTTNVFLIFGWPWPLTFDHWRYWDVRFCCFNQVVNTSSGVWNVGAAACRPSGNIWAVCGPSQRHARHHNWRAWVRFWNTPQEQLFARLRRIRQTAKENPVVLGFFSK